MSLMHPNDVASIWSSALTVRSALHPWPAERRHATAQDVADAVLRIVRRVAASMASMRVVSFGRFLEPLPLAVRTVTAHAIRCALGSPSRPSPIPAPDGAQAGAPLRDRVGWTRDASRRRGPLPPPGAPDEARLPRRALRVLPGAHGGGGPAPLLPARRRDAFRQRLHAWRRGLLLAPPMDAPAQRRHPGVLHLRCVRPGPGLAPEARPRRPEGLRRQAPEHELEAAPGPGGVRLRQGPGQTTHPGPGGFVHLRRGGERRRDLLPPPPDPAARRGGDQPGRARLRARPDAPAPREGGPALPPGRRRPGLPHHGHGEEPAPVQGLRQAALPGRRSRARARRVARSEPGGDRPLGLAETPDLRPEEHTSELHPPRPVV